MTFFIQTQEYRINVFSEIHEIVFHGNGGYDWDTVYEMPIWLRKFTFNKLKEFYKETNGNKDLVEDGGTSNKNLEEAKSQMKKALEFTPTYSTKAKK